MTESSFALDQLFRQWPGLQASELSPSQRKHLRIANTATTAIMVQRQMIMDESFEAEQPHPSNAPAANTRIARPPPEPGRRRPVYSGAACHYDVPM